MTARVRGKATDTAGAPLPAVRTLGSLLRQPALSKAGTGGVLVTGPGLRAAGPRETHSYAAEAAELGTVRAKTGVPQFLHADEAAEHLSDALRGEDSRGADCSLFHTGTGFDTVFNAILKLGGWSAD